MNNYILQTIFNPTTLLGAVFYAAVIVILAAIIGKIMHAAIHRYLNKADAAGTDSTSIRFLAQLGKVVVYIIAFLCYAHFIPALQSLGTAWLASVGVVSIVVGLATQTTLSNLVAGIALVLYRPFRLGDRIQVSMPTGTEIGIVESIDLGYTTLRTADGRKLVFPNSGIANQANINLSRNQAHISCDVAVTLAADSDIKRAREILLEAAKKIPKIAKVNGCFVTGLTPQTVVLTLSAYCIDPLDVQHIKSDILENAKKQFDSAGIKFA